MIVINRSAVAVAAVEMGRWMLGRLEQPMGEAGRGQVDVEGRPCTSARVRKPRTMGIPIPGKALGGTRTPAWVELESFSKRDTNLVAQQAPVVL